MVQWDRKSIIINVLHNFESASIRLKIMEYNNIYYYVFATF